MIRMSKKPKRRQVVRTASIPAPIGGLNARDSIANMPPTDALIMDNWFPGPSDVALRNGSEDYVTGLPDWVETLMTYNSATTSKLFAISDGNIYDATTAGAVGAAVVSGLTNSRWQYVNVGTAAGQFLYAVNGLDSPLLYNGSAWTAITGVSSPAITGVTTSSLVHVNIFKNRVWFVERDSMSVWYLPVNSVGGAAQEIDFSPLFKLGGYLMCMVTWTIDNAGGVDDYAVFITSEGEVAVYRGIDPSSAATWALVGQFRIGRPIGRRCFCKVGSDVIIITADGAIPLSKALLTDRSQEVAISSKIVKLINRDVQLYSGNFGWQPLLYPIGNKLIVNVPQVENNTQYQYVMNTITGAWCRFLGWNAACFEILDDRIFYGGDGVVVQADTGQSDNDSDIQGDVKPAFSYFGASGQQKRFTMCRPIFLTEGDISPAIDLSVDFADEIPLGTPSFSGSSGSAWDISPWNTSPWATGAQIAKNWITIGGIGFAATIRMRLTSNILTVSWQSIDYVYEPGGVL